MFLAEFRYRKKRILGAVISFAVGVAFLIIANSLTQGFKTLTGKPLDEIGCAMTVQRSDNVPEKMEGAVFPCAAVTIKKDEINKIQLNKQIESLSRGILLWVFDSNNFYSIMGFDQNSIIGPALLKNHIINGRYFNNEPFETIVDKTYAENNGLKIGCIIKLANIQFKIIGTVDASQLNKLILANFYVPISAASIVAEKSKSIQSISPFTEGDATILFIKTSQTSLKAVNKKLKEILGDKANITSPLTFYEKFKGITKFFSEFSNIIAYLILLIFIFVTILTILSALNQRKHEFGILKAIGWTPTEVSLYVIKEIFLTCFLGGIFGIIMAYLITPFLGLIKINILIPWELSFSTPHFLMNNPEARMYMTANLHTSVSLFTTIIAFAITCVSGIVLGYFISKKVNKIKPVEAIRNV